MTQEQCVLLSGATQLLVQLLLGVSCLLILYVKYSQEKKRGTCRSVKRFCFDCSKQVFGSFWTHLMNLAFAICFSTFGEQDPCTWYMAEILIDTTVGVYVVLLLHQAIIDFGQDEEAGSSFKNFARNLQTSCVKNEFTESAQARSGIATPLLGASSSEGGEFDLQIYLSQLQAWLIVVTVSKLLMIIALIVFSPQLLGIVSILLFPFDNASVKLIVVMIAFPLIMDNFQFYMQDNILTEMPSFVSATALEDMKTALEEMKQRQDRVSAENDKLRSEVGRHEVQEERRTNLSDELDQLKTDFAGLERLLAHERKSSLTKMLRPSKMSAARTSKQGHEGRDLHRLTSTVKLYRRDESDEFVLMGGDIWAGRFIEVVRYESHRECRYAKIHLPYFSDRYSDRPWIMLQDANGMLSATALSRGLPPTSRHHRGP